MQRTFWLDGAPTTRRNLGRQPELTGVMGVLDALLSAQPATDACPHCGTNQAMIEATGLVGCPLCYAVHETYLLERDPSAPQTEG